MQGSLLASDLKKVISIVDLLRDIGLGTQLSLPKVVVLGNQSSGKSSLLQQIVGMDFLPRGAGVVTRRPLQLRMTNVPELAAPYAQFDEVVEKGIKKKFTNFSQVRKTIDLVTEQVCGTKQNIIDKPIVLNVFSKACPTLTIVDLPGITSIPVGDQPKDIYDITKNMALRYISQERSIILCVIPANQDLAVSQALKIMRQIDPKGERSIGCLTKIDIMNRGDDARKMLKNQQIPLRYGYVGIKNRCQQDVINNVPVQDSLKSQKKFFTTSPIYSSLPSDLFGTDSLTKKLTSILYQQIKKSMPEIFEQIKNKKKIAQEQLQRLGPGVANTDAQMVNYAWKSVATFLRIYKDSLGGIKNSEYRGEPISSTIREELNSLYKEQYDEPATQDITDKDIERAMISFPGQSTIPGFPSIDAFLSILNPLLKRLQNPAYQANNKVHEIMEQQATSIISQVMSAKYPEFNSRFKDLIKKILDKYRKNLQNYLNYLLDSQLFYLFTNDVNYIVGDFNKVNQKKQKQDPKVAKNPLVFELRKRIDAYYKLVVRNLRDLIPKQIFNFLIYKCLRQLQFQAFQMTSDVNKLKQWLNQPSQIRLRRSECMKAIKVFQQSQKRIRMDPDISKLVRSNQKISKYYKDFGMKSPQQIQQEKEEKESQHYALINSKVKNNQPKKPQPKQPPSQPSSQPIQNKQPPPQNNVPVGTKPSPTNNPINNVPQTQQPKQQPKVINNPPPKNNPDFSDFFGPKPTQPNPAVVAAGLNIGINVAKQIPTQTLVKGATIAGQVALDQAKNNTSPIGLNNGPKSPNTDFGNVFGTINNNPNNNPNNQPPKPNPNQPPAQTEQKKKNNFNKLFGI